MFKQMLDYFEPFLSKEFQSDFRQHLAPAQLIIKKNLLRSLGISPSHLIACHMST